MIDCFAMFTSLLTQTPLFSLDKSPKKMSLAVGCSISSCEKYWTRCMILLKSLNKNMKLFPHIWLRYAEMCLQGWRKKWQVRMRISDNIFNISLWRQFWHTYVLGDIYFSLEHYDDDVDQEHHQDFGHPINSGF